MNLRSVLVLGTLLAALSAACAGVIGIDPPSGGTATSGGQPEGPPTNDAAPNADAGADGGACHADLATDPSHCGACGHDCGGGACKAGRCRPLAVVLGSGIETFTVRNGSMFWGQDGAIYRCAAPDCEGGPRYFSGPLTKTSQALLGDDALYVIPFDPPNIAYVSAREAPDWKAYSVNAFVRGAALGTGPAYVAGQVDGPAVQTLVARCTASGCNPANRTALPGAFYGIASTGRDALVATRPDPSISAGSIYRCGPVGCEERALVAVPTLPSWDFFAADEKTLAWATTVDGIEALRACDLPDCAAPRTLGRAQSFAYPTLAVDGEHVYVHDRQARVLRRCGLDRCEDGGELMAEEVSVDWRLVSDGRFLYWFDRPSNVIQRLAK